MISFQSRSKSSISTSLTSGVELVGSAFVAVLEVLAVVVLVVVLVFVVLVFVVLVLVALVEGWLVSGNCLLILISPFTTLLKWSLTRGINGVNCGRCSAIEFPMKVVTICIAGMSMVPGAALGGSNGSFKSLGGSDGGSGYSVVSDGSDCNGDCVWDCGCEAGCELSSLFTWELVRVLSVLGMKGWFCWAFLFEEKVVEMVLLTDLGCSSGVSGLVVT